MEDTGTNQLHDRRPSTTLTSVELEGARNDVDEGSPPDGDRAIPGSVTAASPWLMILVTSNDGSDIMGLHLDVSISSAVRAGCGEPVRQRFRLFRDSTNFLRLTEATLPSNLSISRPESLHDASPPQASALASDPEPAPAPAGPAPPPAGPRARLLLSGAALQHRDARHSVVILFSPAPEVTAQQTADLLFRVHGQDGSTVDTAPTELRSREHMRQVLEDLSQLPAHTRASMATRAAALPWAA